MKTTSLEMCMLGCLELLQALRRIVVPIAGVVCSFALPLDAQAAAVSWGQPQTVVNNTDIQSVGVTSLAGANFGRTTGTTNSVNNGSVNVEFKSMNSNQSVTLANGVTVSASGYNFDVNCSAPVGVTGDYRAVMTRHMGVGGGTGTIQLAGLTIGTQYQVQVYITGSDNNTSNIAGSPSLVAGGGNNPSNNNGFGKWIVGTFTADALTQSLTHSANTNEPVINALTIGIVDNQADTTAPDWIATWPQVVPSSATALTVRAKTNEIGTAYYVVLPDGATAPSAAQVKAGTDSINTAVASSGSLALTPSVEGIGTVTGLSPSTLYDVYFVAQDAVPNLQASPVMVDASTPAPDITAPLWIATWPQAEQWSATSLIVRARSNETGFAYFVVLADGALAPSAAQVKAGNDSANTPAMASGSLPLVANTEATVPVINLIGDAAYDIYFVAEDAVPNVQATPVLVNISLVSPAVVTWGSWLPVTDETAIQTPGGYTYGGVNFNGSTTTIGSVTFTGISLNASGIANGITVSTSGFGFQSTGGGNSNVSSTVGSPQTWATVLDRVIGDDDNLATINLTGLTPGTGYTVQFFSSTPDANINGTTKLSSGGTDSPFFGSPHATGATRSIIASFTATSTSQSFSITGAEPTFGALVVGVESPGSTFANWISGFTGLNGLTGFTDDADFDGLDNGVENFLGTAPNASNAGLLLGTFIGSTLTITHPQNATPATDVTAPIYTWSTDLLNWNANGASAGGITVNLTPATNTPTPGTTTVSANITGPVPPKLFVRLEATQP